MKQIIRKWYKKLSFPTEWEAEFENMLENEKLIPCSFKEYDDTENLGQNLPMFLYFCEDVEERYKKTGIPEEIAPLLLVKPLSGSGSIAVLSDILGKYGVDSYIARCACVAYGSSETIFYIGAVYFAGIKRKKLSLALFISVLSYLLSVVLCCFLCRFM